MFSIKILGNTYYKALTWSCYSRSELKFYNYSLFLIGGKKTLIKNEFKQIKGIWAKLFRF